MSEAIKDIAEHLKGASQSIIYIDTGKLLAEGHRGVEFRLVTHIANGFLQMQLLTSLL